LSLPPSLFFCQQLWHSLSWLLLVAISTRRGRKRP